MGGWKTEIERQRDFRTQTLSGMSPPNLFPYRSGHVTEGIETVQESKKKKGHQKNKAL